MSFLNGSAIQPINFNIIATADATGTATFAFEAVALSNTWTGTLNCATAPDTAQFTAVSGATTFGQFKGANSYGPVQLQVGDQLNVNATGLVPGTQYSMTLLGVNHVVVEPPITWPAPYADSVTTSTEQIYLMTETATISGTTGYKLYGPVAIENSWRSIYVVAYLTGTGSANVNNLYIAATGQTSGLVYQPFYPPYIDITNGTSGGPTAVVARFAMINGLDESVEISVTYGFSTSVSGVTLTTVIGADLTPIDSAVYSETGISSTTSAISTKTQYGGLPVVNLQYATGSSTYATLPLEVTATTTTGVPIADYTYGGTQFAKVSTSSTANTLLVATPGVGYRLRIQSITLDITGTFPTTNAQYLWIAGLGTNNVFANMIIPATAATISFNGLLLATDTAIYVQAPNSTAATWSVYYDIVTSPTIS